MNDQRCSPADALARRVREAFQVHEWIREVKHDPKDRLDAGYALVKVASEATKATWASLHRKKRGEQCLDRWCVAAKDSLNRFLRRVYCDDGDWKLIEECAVALSNKDAPFLVAVHAAFAACVLLGPAEYGGQLAWRSLLRLASPMIGDDAYEREVWKLNAAIWQLEPPIALLKRWDLPTLQEPNAECQCEFHANKENRDEDAHDLQLHNPLWEALSDGAVLQN